MVGTVEEALARKTAIVEFGGLTDYDKAHIGSAVRIEIPFSDEFKLRKVADILRGYADFIDNTTRQHNLPLKSRLWLIRSEASDVNRKIKALHDPERFNKNGTTKAGTAGSR